jgi:5-methylcytosine-specific restriction protein A
MTRRNMSTSRRARIFNAHGGVCHICGLKINVGERWDADHIIALEISGNDGDDNLAPAHEACHRSKTSTADIPQIAKAKRVAAKHTGAWRPRSIIPGSKASRWRKPINGTVERRET